MTTADIVGLRHGFKYRTSYVAMVSPAHKSEPLPVVVAVDAPASDPFANLAICFLVFLLAKSVRPYIGVSPSRYR